MIVVICWCMGVVQSMLRNLCVACQQMIQKKNHTSPLINSTCLDWICSDGKVFSFRNNLGSIWIALRSPLIVFWVCMDWVLVCTDCVLEIVGPRPPLIQLSTDIRGSWIKGGLGSSPFAPILCLAYCDGRYLDDYWRWQIFGWLLKREMFERLLKMADNWIIVEDGRYLDDCRRRQIFGWLSKMADIWIIV